jgi:type II secretory pathway predicted ATPase ExeA
MYEAYWKLTDNPFASRAAGEPFFPSETHQAALLKIRYVIEHRKGTAAVIGARGVGKTFLARTLSTQLAATGPFVHITYPQMSPHELLAYLGRQWGLESLSTTEPLPTDRLIAELQQAFAQHEKAGKHPVILVDDAHLIEDPQVLQCLRQLVHLRGRGEADCSVVLLGHGDLLPRIRRIADLDDRIAVKCLIRPLTAAETQGYIESRLATAGRSDEQPIFSGEALGLIHERSAGLPRRINRICDLALLVGYADDLTHLDAAHIDAVAEELDAVIAD